VQYNKHTKSQSLDANTLALSKDLTLPRSIARQKCYCYNCNCNWNWKWHWIWEFWKFWNWNQHSTYRVWFIVRVFLIIGLPTGLKPFWQACPHKFTFWELDPWSVCQLIRNTFLPVIVAVFVVVVTAVAVELVFLFSSRLDPRFSLFRPISSNCCSCYYEAGTEAQIYRNGNNQVIQKILKSLL